MKTHFYLALLFLSFASQAQPTVTSSNTFPAFGFTDTVLTASGSNVGASGANVTWDFSTMSVTPVATFAVMAPASTPHASSFPAATHSLQLTPLTSSNSLYDFYRHSGAGWEILASNYTGSSGDVYSVNSKMRIPFPFNYNNSVLDTFQKIGGSPDGYTITYDGWGTLKTPGRTLNNVIRIKYQWLGGEIRYEWFTTSPLFYAATWNQNGGGTFNFLGRNSSTGIGVAPDEEIAVSIFPNPANGLAFIRTSLLAGTNAILAVRDALGRTMLTQPLDGAFTQLDISRLANGVYMWDVQSAGNHAAHGRLIIQ